MILTAFGSVTAARTLAIVCLVHFLSHCYIIVLPPLFLLMAPDLQVGYTELGLALTAFSVATTLSQPSVGKMVDDHGAHGILMAGLLLGGGCLVLIGFWHSYPALLLLMTVAGLANSAFHPADYAILGRTVAPENMGKAFSLHTFAGFLGSAVTPMTVALIAARWSWSAGVIAVGVTGMAAAALIPQIPPLPARSATSNDTQPTKRVGLQGAIIALTFFFFLVALSGTGIQSFVVVALTAGWSISMEWANVLLTVYLGATAIGVLVGGLLADRFRQHELIAALSFLLAGVVLLPLATGAVPAALLVMVFAVTGILIGMVMPSRDMMVHQAATPETTGRVFGIVTTGLNAGGIVAPPLFGYLVDHEWYGAVFALSALVMIIAGVMALLQTRRATA